MELCRTLSLLAVLLLASTHANAQGDTRTISCKCETEALNLQYCQKWRCEDEADVGECFSAGSTVLTEDGPVKMADLKMGTKVLVTAESGRLYYDYVDSFLHREPSREGEFVDIVAGHTQLRVSPGHVLFASHGDSFSTEAQLVQDLREGDLIWVRDANNQLQATPIKSITRVQDTGMYSPMTASGTIVVNNVAASCYALVADHDRAHKYFAPMRWYYSLRRLIGSPASTPPTGLHAYAKSMITLSKFITPKGYVAEIP